MLDKDAVATLIATVTKDHKVDILVNVAGIQRRSPAEDYTWETFEEVIQINLAATFVLCRDIGKYWIENKINGKVINTASLATFLGNVKMAVYAMSKGGVGQLTKALANEWAEKGINVNAIAPGWVLIPHMTYAISTDIVFSQIHCNGYECRHANRRPRVPQKPHRSHPRGSMG